MPPNHEIIIKTIFPQYSNKLAHAGKLNVVVVLGPMRTTQLRSMFIGFIGVNYTAEPMGVLKVGGISQCYQCGYGHSFAAGARRG